MTVTRMLRGPLIATLLLTACTAPTPEQQTIRDVRQIMTTQGYPNYWVTDQHIINVTENHCRQLTLSDGDLAGWAEQLDRVAARENWEPSYRVFLAASLLMAGTLCPEWQHVLP